MSVALYYTRCPVPTASGIAFQRRMFDPVFRGTSYEVRDLRELGPDHRNAHYTHSIRHFFREGGGAPPVWARSRGVDSVLLGITFMEETLGIFVRADDPAITMPDLAGKRFALPVWPRLVFNFWRFAALKGIVSALRIHSMSVRDIRLVDVTEDWDPHERRDVQRRDAPAAPRCEYRNQLRALRDGRVDALFGKGPEAALLEREAGGAIRRIFDLRTAPEMADRVNNSTPRLLTTSREMVEAHPEGVVRYLQTLIRAARWAVDHPREARKLVARECGVTPHEVARCLENAFETKLAPGVSDALLESVNVLKSFLHRHGFIEHDFPLRDWIAAEPLAEARRREEEAPQATARVPVPPARGTTGSLRCSNVPGRTGRSEKS